MNKPSERGRQALPIERLKPKAWRILGASALVLLAITIIAGQIFLSSRRRLTEVETAFFASATFAVSLWASWLFAQEDSESKAKRYLKPLAESALRRVVNLYGASDRLRRLIRLELDKMVENQEARSSLHILEAVVEEHLATARDAIGDWGQILPEESKEIVQQYSLVSEIAAREDALREAQAELEKADKERVAEVDAAQEKVRLLQVEREQLKRDLAAVKAKSAITLPTSSYISPKYGMPTSSKYGSIAERILLTSNGGDDVLSILATDPATKTDVMKNITLKTEDNDENAPGSTGE